MLIAAPAAAQSPGAEVGAEGAPPGAEVTVVTYQVAYENDHQDDPVAGEVLNFTYNASKLHSLHALEHRLVLKIWASGDYLADSEGTWNLSFSQDGIPIPGCTGHIQTSDLGGFLAGDFFDNRISQADCLRTGNHTLDNIYHTHTITADLSVDGGTPADLIHLDISIGVYREDRVVIPMDINISNLEYWIPVLLSLTLTVGSFILIFRAHWAWIFPWLLGSVATLWSTFPEVFGAPERAVLVVVVFCLVLMVIVGKFGADDTGPIRRQ